MARFDNIGKAILFLREKQNKSQKDLAREAGITSAMLSNYETGVKKPSLDSLGKILDALGLYLGRIDDSLDMLNDRPLRARQLGFVPVSERSDRSGIDIESFIGAQEELPPDLEEGFVEMIHGFRQIARYMYKVAVDGKRKT